MKILLYSMYDLKARVYGPVFCAAHNTAALRVFSDEVLRNRDSVLSRYPADFSLYQVGEFFVDSGAIVAPEQPVFLAAATEFVDSSVAPVEPAGAR